MVTMARLLGGETWAAQPGKISGLDYVRASDNVCLAGAAGKTSLHYMENIKIIGKLVTDIKSRAQDKGHDGMTELQKRTNHTIL